MHKFLFIGGSSIHRIMAHPYIEKNRSQIYARCLSGMKHLLLIVLILSDIELGKVKKGNLSSITQIYIFA